MKIFLFVFVNFGFYFVILHPKTKVPEKTIFLKTK